MTDLNLMLKQSTYHVRETIYDIGNSLDNLYILQSGILSMKTRLTLTEHNRYPIEQNKWEVISTERNYEYELQHIQVGDIFGHQELIEHF